MLCRIRTSTRTRSTLNSLKVRSLSLRRLLELIHIVVDPEWSKEETDYLFETIEDYDSRFLIVHDRYEFPGGVPRSLEVRVMS